MSDAIHSFDRAMDLVAVGDGRWRGETSEDYWNMVGPFGGYVAALLLKAASIDPRRSGEPVALTVNFCAAVQQGGFELHAAPVRTGRSTQHWTAKMVQDGACVATATAMFGTRPETFAHRTIEMPEAPKRSSLYRFDAFPSGWTRQYDMRFVRGAPEGPVGEAMGETPSLIWVESVPPRPLDFLALAAMCDVFFGRIIHVRRRMVPFGTVTMTAYFHATAADLEALGATPLLGEVDSRIFDRGYHDQSAALWSPDGQLLATSHQLVYFRDPA